MEAALIDSIIKTNPSLTGQKDKLKQLKKGSYCVHRAWGVGCITDFDESSGKLMVAFENQGEPRSMDPGFFVSKLTLLPENHIIARHRREPAEIQALLDTNPAEVFLLILSQTPDGSMSVIEMEETLQYLLGENYKKWLSPAKKRAAKDGRITFPEKKTDRYQLHSEPVAAEDEALVAFYKTKNVKKKIELASSLLEKTSLSQEIISKLPTLISELNAALSESRILTPSEKLQGSWVRDDLAHLAKIDGSSMQPSAAAIVRESRELQELAEKLPSQYQARLLNALMEAHPNDWTNILFDLLKNSSGKFTQECVSFLLDNNQSSTLNEMLNKWLDEQLLKAPLISWILKNRNVRRYSTMLSPLISPRLFSAIFYAIDREAIQNASSKRISLVELLAEDRELVGELLSTATPEMARDLANTLLMSQGFETLTKRSLLARFIKQFPEIQSLISTEESTAQEDGLIVSWESLEKRKADYQHLVTVKIPKNKEDIAIAREHGDLSENSEYKMARQDQDTFMAQKSQMEAELRIARGTDFIDCPTDMVGVGSIVELQTSSGKASYTILGAWDGNPEKNILSYKTPLAQGLLGKRTGESVSVGGQSYTITGLKRYADSK